MQVLERHQNVSAKILFIFFVCVSLGTVVNAASADGGKCASGDVYPVMRTLGVDTLTKYFRSDLKKIFENRNESELKVDNVMYVRDLPDQTSLIIRDVLELRKYKEFEKDNESHFVFDKRFDTEIFFPSAAVQTGSAETKKEFLSQLEKPTVSSKLKLSLGDGEERLIFIEALWLHYYKKRKTDIFKPFHIKLLRSSRDNCFESFGSVDGKNMRKINLSVLFASVRETKTVGNALGALLFNKELPILRAGSVGQIHSDLSFLKETQKHTGEQSGNWSSGTPMEYREFKDAPQK